MESVWCPIRSTVCGSCLGSSLGVFASTIDLIALSQGVGPHRVLKISSIATATISFVVSYAFFNKFVHPEISSETETKDLEEDNLEEKRGIKVLINNGEYIASAAISSLAATTISSAFVIFAFNLNIK
ncbi:MAG: hypothetical protein K940chlam1_00891 [Candidatus Anoxychlamydiales bacterium]|nr:hypothetical protein [Candidatus Anoxychlamydiales bacterium]NGX36359.1 hypothetical protein [Candidatus Anoxychlamydiales bacterium]